MEIEKLPGGAAPLAWHPAFFQAIKMELLEYRDFLEFKFEHQLVSEPLRIDLVVVKKPRDLVIDKNIARMFKADNIIEYKSPDDYLSVNDFLRVVAYAHYYAATTPNADFSDLTVTFVESRRPRALLEYLTTVRRYRADETSLGIYTVTGDYLPIQVIESKRLPESENLWLKSLTKDLAVGGANDIMAKRVTNEPGVEFGIYLDVISKANSTVFKEAYRMNTATFEEVFTEAGIIPEWMARGEAKGIVKGKAEDARNLLAEGLTIEFVQRITGLDREQILNE